MILKPRENILIGFLEWILQTRTKRKVFCTISETSQSFGREYLFTDCLAFFTLPQVTLFHTSSPEWRSCCDLMQVESKIVHYIQPDFFERVEIVVKTHAVQNVKSKGDRVRQRHLSKHLLGVRFFKTSNRIGMVCWKSPIIIIFVWNKVHISSVQIKPKFCAEKKSSLFFFFFSPILLFHFLPFIFWFLFYLFLSFFCLFH